MKRVLRIKACLAFDPKERSVEEIIEILQKLGGLYAITIVSETSLKSTPQCWLPKGTLNHTFKRE